MNRTWKILILIGCIVAFALATEVIARLIWVYFPNYGNGSIDYHSTRSFWDYGSNVFGIIAIHLTAVMTLVALAVCIFIMLVCGLGEGIAFGFAILFILIATPFMWAFAKSPDPIRE